MEPDLSGLAFARRRVGLALTAMTQLALVDLGHLRNGYRAEWPPPLEELRDDSGEDVVAVLDPNQFK